MTRPVHPFISVIVPVYRDAGGLALCLAALSRQTYPADRFEVLVVDNEPPPSRYGGLVAALPGRVRLVSEPTVGSYAARNRGVREAEGELLAFTDADCVPTPTWLEEAARRWNELPPASVIAGRIDLTYRGPRKSVAELFDAIFLGFPQERFAMEDHFAATANMICAREVFDLAGPFSESTFSGGDYEWGRRAHAAGAGVHYAAGAAVSHPARASLASVFRKIRRLTGGVWHVVWENHSRATVRGKVAAEIHRCRRMRNMLRAASEPASRLQRAALKVLIAFFQTVRVAEIVRLAAGGRPTRH